MTTASFQHQRLSPTPVCKKWLLSVGPGLMYGVLMTCIGGCRDEAQTRSNATTQVSAAASDQSATSTVTSIPDGPTLVASQGKKPDPHDATSDALPGGLTVARAKLRFSTSGPGRLQPFRYAVESADGQCLLLNATAGTLDVLRPARLISAAKSGLFSDADFSVYGDPCACFSIDGQELYVAIEKGGWEGDWTIVVIKQGSLQYLKEVRTGEDVSKVAAEHGESGLRTLVPSVAALSTQARAARAGYTSPNVLRMCVSPNGKYIAVGVSERIVLLNANDGTYVATTEFFEREIPWYKRGFSFDSTSDHLLLKLGDDLAVWSVPRLERTFGIGPHPAAVSAFAVAPNGAIAVGYDNGELVLRKSDFQVSESLELGSRPEVVGLGFDRDSKFLFSLLKYAADDLGLGRANVPPVRVYDLACFRRPIEPARVFEPRKECYFDFNPLGSGWEFQSFFVSSGGRLLIIGGERNHVKVADYYILE